MPKAEVVKQYRAADGTLHDTREKAERAGLSTFAAKLVDATPEAYSNAIETGTGEIAEAIKAIAAEIARKTRAPRTRKASAAPTPVATKTASKRAAA